MTAPGEAHLAFVRRRHPCRRDGLRDCLCCMLLVEMDDGGPGWRYGAPIPPAQSKSPKRYPPGHERIRASVRVGYQRTVSAVNKSLRGSMCVPRFGARLTHDNHLDPVWVDKGSPLASTANQPFRWRRAHLSRPRRAEGNDPPAGGLPSKCVACAQPNGPDAVHVVVSAYHSPGMPSGPSTRLCSAAHPLDGGERTIPWVVSRNTGDFFLRHSLSGPGWGGTCAYAVCTLFLAGWVAGEMDGW